MTKDQKANDQVQDDGDDDGWASVAMLVQQVIS